MQAEPAPAPVDCQPANPTENQSLGQFLDDARSKGYRVEHQAAWPNGAGWITLVQQAEDENQVRMMVNYYPDHTFTSRSV